MKLSKRQLRQIIRKTLQEGAYEKLNSEVTGDDSNLDQEVYFGLEEGIEELIALFAENERYAKHGVTYNDVFEEFLNVVDDMRRQSRV